MSNHIITGPGIDQADVDQAGAQGRSIEDPNKPITASMLAEILSGGSSGGQNVTAQGSMKVAAVWACVWTISAAIARMPLITYQRTPNGRERATKHPHYRMLRMRPNTDMSAYSFYRAIMTNVLLWGNGYAEIVRDRRGEIAELIPIEASRVRPFRAESGELMYSVATSGQPVTLLKRDMLHVPGLSYDGVVGMSVISHARATIAASLSADSFTSNLMQRGLRPSGVLQHPGKLGPEGVRNLRESMTVVYGGSENAGKPMILEEGMTWATSAMPLDDAQFVESAYLRIEDICRWFNVPPHKIQHLLRATNNNIEQQSLDWLGDTVAPWSEAIQQEANWKLFNEDEQDEFYAEFLTQVLVQMDANTRGTFYGKLFQVGAVSPDEIRDRENMNHLPDGRGEVYYIPSNMMPAPTPEEATKLLAGYVSKAGTGGPGQPQPKTDDKVAGAG